VFQPDQRIIHHAAAARHGKTQRHDSIYVCMCVRERRKKQTKARSVRPLRQRQWKNNS
jgi:hypothetical protein